MSELMRWDELGPGGVVTPAESPRPKTGDWRTNGRPELRLDRCVSCLLCWLYCPDSAFKLEGTTLVGIDYDVCKGCELCVEVCPAAALAMAPEADA
ncbi:MAG TPA: 4Fe-4S binding protein [Gaiellaceae bacterium]|jgi:2-oxoacid:acceptor oxidoreductase delta subunit (pyruvate/2-ketoisovalerate family)